MNTNANVMQNAVSLMGVDIGKGKGDPTPKKVPIEQDENQKFGNWMNNNDPKVFAKDLMNRGLQGAEQLYNDNPDTSSKSGIINAQSDWKIAAIQQILANAKKFNIRNPEAVMANKHTLIGNSRWSDAIDNPNFNQIHNNFWQTVATKLLPEQWKKYDEANKNNLATNTK